jgi:ribosome modulation factor
MKKQKRDLHERAYQHGYHAGLGGRHQDLCPHHEGDMRGQWLAGWREGRVDHWGGLNIITGIQKMAAR